MCTGVRWRWIKRHVEARARTETRSPRGEDGSGRARGAEERFIAGFFCSGRGQGGGRERLALVVSDSRLGLDTADIVPRARSHPDWEVRMDRNYRIFVRAEPASKSTFLYRAITHEVFGISES